MFALNHSRLSPSRGLTVASFVSSAGDGIYYVTAALYFTTVVGLSPAVLGAVLTFAWGIGLGAGVPLGHLADRRGPRGIGVLFMLGAGLALSGYLFTRSLSVFVVLACIYTICQRGASSAQQALMANLVTGSELVKVRARIIAMYNLGLSIGAAIGASALVFGTERAFLTVFAIDAVSFFVAAVILMALPAAPAAGPGEDGGPALSVLRDRPFAVLTILNAMLALYVPIFDVALPLWVTHHTQAPHWIIAAIFVANALLVVAFQVRVAGGVKDIRGATRYVRLAGFVQLAACLVYAASAFKTSQWLAAGVLLLGVTIQTFGEMLHFSGTTQISFGLAPANKQGQYQAFFGSGLTISEMIGPLALTSLLIYGGPPGWFALGVIFVLAGLAIGPVTRWAERTRPVAATVEP
ncbi:MFS transporter [Streptomyces angustmyceticus]|uniref:MFS transporter n=1 Tax=Streptomyces angustmyceticus TaxID=285578 RepID=UPI003D93FAE0